MENIRYSTSSGPTGPWEYRGMIMPPEGASWTNHPGVADYKGNSYFVYHNAALPGGGNGQRSVCVEQLEYNADGTIPEITMTEEGPDPVDTLNPFAQTEAETIAWESGVETEACSEGGVDVTDIHNGDYIKVREVDFRTGAESFSARVAGNGGNIELHLDSEVGTLIGTCTIEQTGGPQTWNTQTCTVSGATGKHDLFLKFTGGNGTLFNFNWWQFEGPGDPGTGGSGGAGGQGGAAGASGSEIGGWGAIGGNATGGTGTGGGVAGAAGHGGISSSGGAPTGGTTGTGGVVPSGGFTAAGGDSYDGGTTVIGAGGGSVSMGGSMTATGGTVPAAGGSSSGGTGTAAGGQLGAGGSTAAGGAVSSGGFTVSGGASFADVDAGPAGTDAASDEGGCGCFVAARRSSSGSLAAFWVAGLLALCSIRRRPRASSQIR
jgi:arabinoxylan arabinofuranohydrolase